MLRLTYPHFVPDIVVTLEHGKVVLYWHNEAMSVYQFLGQSAGEVDSCAHGNDRSFGDFVVLAETEWTGRKDFLRSLVIYYVR